MLEKERAQTVLGQIEKESVQTIIGVRKYYTSI